MSVNKIRPMSPAAENFMQICARIIADAARRSTAMTAPKGKANPNSKATPARGK